MIKSHPLLLRYRLMKLTCKPQEAITTFLNHRPLLLKYQSYTCKPHERIRKDQIKVIMTLLGLKPRTSCFLITGPIDESHGRMMTESQQFCNHEDLFCDVFIGLALHPFMQALIQVSIICDAIQGNQSEVERVTFSIFYLIEMPIWRGTFC